MGESSSFRSFIWQFFTITDKKYNDHIAQCLLCKKKVKRGKKGETSNFSTSPLHSHVKACHPSNYEPAKEIERQKNQLPSNALAELDQVYSYIKPVKTEYVTDIPDEPYDINDPTSTDINQKILQMMVQDNLPSVIVENDGFINLMAHLAPRYLMPRREYFSEIMLNNIPDVPDTAPLDVSNTMRPDNLPVNFASSMMREETHPAGSSLSFHDQPKGYIPNFSHSIEQIDVKSEPIYDTINEVEDENTLSNTGASTHSSPSSRQPSPTPPGMTGPYLLKKETHCHNILDELLKDETYADVTLTAEGQTIKAHRIILSLSSKYFRSVLSTEANAKNILLFRDMKFQELRDIINFIYTGEVTVDASDLDSFMKTADILEVTSLCNSHKKFPKGFNIGNYSTDSEPKQSVSKRPNTSSQQSPPSKIRKTANDTPRPTKRSSTASTMSHESTPQKSVPTPSQEPFPIVSISGNLKPKEEEIEVDTMEHNILQAECILSDPDNDPGDELNPQQSCVPCSSKFDSVDHMFQHLEKAHENDEVFPCEDCIQIFDSSTAFDRHKSNCRPNSSSISTSFNVEN